MDRLPIKFEKEVLEPVEIKYQLNGWYWKKSKELQGDGHQEYQCYVSDYEIAARGLEAITNNIEYGLFNISEKINNGEGDLLECIFKEIKEVYKDES